MILDSANTINTWFKMLKKNYYSTNFSSKRYKNKKKTMCQFIEHFEAHLRGEEKQQRSFKVFFSAF